MSDGDCRNELVTRERAGELSPAERVALDAHLVQCGSCRLSRLLGHDFDVERTLEANDGVRIAALSATAERWALGAPRPVAPLSVKRRRARIALLAIAAAFAAVGASAAAGTWSKLFDSSDVAPVVAAQPAPAVERNVAAAPRTPVASEQARPAPDKPEARPRPTVPNSTAASLLTEASAARRAGEADRAIALYRRLENEFPKSPEAGLAALPLGGLLLDRGDARAALGQFDRHVRGGQSSRLLPEALYGRGRSLAALGNRAEERRTWTQLLEQFPQSPYAGHARRRLGELPSAD